MRISVGWKFDSQFYNSFPVTLPKQLQMVMLSQKYSLVKYQITFFLRFGKANGR